MRFARRKTNSCSVQNFRGGNTFHDKDIFQFVVYYYKPSPNKLKATPNAADQVMDLLLSRPTNTGENQPGIHLKLRISVNTTFTTKNLKFAPEHRFSAQMFLICTE